MNRIRELREEKGITQVRLSIELEVSQETIGAYEAGKHYPSLKTLIKMRKILDANIDYILGLSNTRHDPIYVNKLKENEAEILQLYRKLDYSGREYMKGYMIGYLDAMQEKQHF